MHGGLAACNLFTGIRHSAEDSGGLALAFFALAWFGAAASLRAWNRSVEADPPVRR